MKIDKLFVDDKTGEVYDVILVNDYKLIRIPGDQENTYHLINENAVNNDDNRFYEFEINQELMYIDKYEYHLCKHGKITRSYTEYLDLLDLLDKLHRMRDHNSTNNILNNQLAHIAMDLSDLIYPCYTCYTEY